MTEIAFLVKLMTQYKLPKPAKDEIISRIGEVESSLSSVHRPSVMIPPPAPLSVRGPAANFVDPQDMAGPPPAPRKIAQQEIITSTGNGTSVRGPRKF